LISLSSSEDFRYNDAACIIVIKCISSKKKVVIPSAVVEIRSYAFQECIPRDIIYETSSNLKIISDHAFHYSNLVSVVLPPSVQKVGECCFFRSQYLRTVEIQYLVTSIPFQMLYGCGLLKTIIIGGDYILQDGFLDFSNASLIRTIDSYSFSGTSIISTKFPSAISIYSDGIFKDYKFLQTVEIQYPLLSIFDEMFYVCTSLKSIFIADNYILRDSVLDFSKSSSITSIVSFSLTRFNNFCQIFISIHKI
jgi:hypothetical protein